jgi:hypothetical protein
MEAVSMRSRPGVAALVLTTVVASGVLLTTQRAGAGTSKKVSLQSISCSSITGAANAGDTLTVSGCTGPTGGSGTVRSPFWAPSTIHWKAGGTTTVTFNPMPRQTPTCPGHTTAFTVLDGKVKKSTGKAKAITGGFHVTFCFPGGNYELKPGTLMRFGRK